MWGWTTIPVERAFEVSLPDACAEPVAEARVSTSVARSILEVAIEPEALNIACRNEDVEAV